MTFKEKIDSILKYNSLEINSVSALEDAVTAGRGAINDFYKDNREPGRKTLKKIKSLKGLNTDWYDTGIGLPFDENHTSVQETSNNKKNGAMNARETFYEELMEKNKDYFVAPRAIFTDYKIVPDKIIDVIIQSTEEAKKALEKQKDLEIESLIIKHETIIKGLNIEIEKLRGDNDDLRRQIPGQS